MVCQELRHRSALRWTIDPTNYNSYTIHLSPGIRFHQVPCRMGGWVGYQMKCQMGGWVGYQMKCRMGGWVGCQMKCQMGGWVGYQVKCPIHQLECVSQVYGKIEGWIATQTKKNIT